MKTVRLVFLLAAMALVAGCVVGPSREGVVIETGAAGPGDDDYARALAARLAPSSKPNHAANALLHPSS